MILPKSYLDKTCGVRPGKNQEDSFNNIVYTMWYMIARVRQNNFNKYDLDALIKHLDETNDEHGLYKPKNSHDNVTYKMIASKLFHLNREEDMNFFRAIKEIGIYRIWDVITYGAVFGPKLLRPLFALLLWIPAIQMVHSCGTARYGKVRPKWFGAGDDSRIKWWFKSRKQVKEEMIFNQVYKTWEFKDGTTKQSRHMQNDGKHVSVFRLYAFKDEFKSFNWAAKKCRKSLIEMYGEDYTYEIIKTYLRDQKHPVIAMWKGHGDIL